MAAVLFEDIFDVKNIDPEGKKFDRGIYISAYKVNFDVMVYAFTNLPR